MLDLPNRVLKAAFDRRGKDGIELPNAAQQTGQQLHQREHIRSERFNLFVSHFIEVRMAAGQHGVPWLGSPRRDHAISAQRPVLVTVAGKVTSYGYPES